MYRERTSCAIQNGNTYDRSFNIWQHIQCDNRMILRICSNPQKIQRPEQRHFMKNCASITFFLNYSFEDVLLATPETYTELLVGWDSNYDLKD